MTHAPKFRAFLPLAGMAIALLLTSQVRAAGLADWFGWGTPTTVTTGYAPGYGYYYAPATAYRTLYAPVAVTSYQPVTACSACGAPAVTSYMPVTTYVQRPILQAYTAYQPVYAAAPACSACGGSSCGGSTCGCSSCGCARPACSACGGGCASGACGAALAPSTAPVYPVAASGAPSLSYMAPISSTSYAPTQAYASVNPSYPVPAAYTTPAYVAAPTVTYPAPSYPAPTSGALNQTYTMPALPGNPPVANSVVRPSVPAPTPTLAPPKPAANSADIAPALPGPVPPTPVPPPSETPKNFGDPTVPSPAPLTPIPDNSRNPNPPGTSGSRPPIDPNSRTASSMPMLWPGNHRSTPWPVAKTTAVLMPVAPMTPSVLDDADGWHAVR